LWDESGGDALQKGEVFQLHPLNHLQWRLTHEFTHSKR
jgi:hypothetical protein